MIRHIKKEVILLILMMIFSLMVCGAVTAHPGHGTPIEEPSDPGTSDTSTETTDTGSTSTSESAPTSSSSASTSSRSTSISATKSSTSTSGGNEQTGDNTQTVTDVTASLSGPEEVIENTGSMDSDGGPIAMFGLMVVIGLVAMSFPYHEGGNLRKLQLNLFGR